ncbi:MAG TPA: hypothetical protein PKW33_22045 [Anaerolineaceae bacterium]|nr:hypothetical protein [Anaerolineaceae bacterium]HPN54291.1 hypothetical protein [Anaerolineaceae bacterium]
MRNKIFLLLFFIGVIVFCILAVVEARKADKCWNIKDKSNGGGDLELSVTLGDKTEFAYNESVPAYVRFKNIGPKSLFINPNWVRKTNYNEEVLKAGSGEQVKDGEYARMKLIVVNYQCKDLIEFTDMVFMRNIDVDKMQQEMVEIKPGEEVSYTIEDALTVYWSDIGGAIYSSGKKQFAFYVVYSNQDDPWGSNMVWKGMIYSNLVTFNVKK